MALNKQAKGKEGEREIVALLEPIVRKVLTRLEHPAATHPVPIVQRNQNQSAVGGSDLTNTFGLAIEVKRQEALSVNEWWKQTVASASRNGELPVLLYRQNQKKWRAVMLANLYLPYVTEPHGLPMSYQVRAEVGLEDFLAWFEQHVVNMLHTGHELRI